MLWRFLATTSSLTGLTLHTRGELGVVMVVCKFAIGETKTGVAIHNLIDLTVMYWCFLGTGILGDRNCWRSITYSPLLCMVAYYSIFFNGICWGFCINWAAGVFLWPSPWWHEEHGNCFFCCNIWSWCILGKFPNYCDLKNYR